MTDDIDPYVRGLISELVGYTSAAIGQVREKEHWMSVAQSSLYKLESFGVEKGEHDV